MSIQCSIGILLKAIDNKPINILKIENKELTESLLTPDEPAPFVILNSDAILPVLLVCDHASNRFPRSLGTMGLDYLDRVSHIALDIGANAVAETLADNLGATAVLCQYSRLIVDCNRELIDDSAFLECSNGVDVPGNNDLQENEKEKRASEIYWRSDERRAGKECRSRWSPDH